MLSVGGLGLKNPLSLLDELRAHWRLAQRRRRPGKQAKAQESLEPPHLRPYVQAAGAAKKTSMSVMKPPAMDELSCLLVDQLVLRMLGPRKARLASRAQMKVQRKGMDA